MPSRNNTIVHSHDHEDNGAPHFLIVMSNFPNLLKHTTQYQVSDQVRYSFQKISSILLLMLFLAATTTTKISQCT